METFPWFIFWYQKQWRLCNLNVSEYIWRSLYCVTMQTQSVLTCCTAFSCEAGEFLEMSSQQCTSCAAGSYSLGSGVRFDQWDSIPAGFSSLATYMDSGGSGDDSMTCNKSVPSYILNIYIHIFNSLCFYRSESTVNIVLFNCSSSWTPQGTLLESNRDDCTVSLVYAVHLMKQGSVSFDYQYVDSNVFFEFFVCFTSYIFQFFLKMCWSENISKMFYFWCRFRMTNVRRWTRQGVRNGSNSPLTESGEPIRLTLFIFKGTVHSKLKIQSSFTPNLYDFLSSAEHHRRYFEECW